MKRTSVKQILAAAMTTAIVLGMAACGQSKSEEASGTPATEAAQTEQSGQAAQTEVPENIRNEIRFATIAAPPTLDIQMITNITGKSIAEYNVFEKLMEYDANYELFPVLAESFEVNPDNTEYIYYLRKDVKFHNGAPMTADDVVASMNRWIEKVSAAGSLFGDSRFEKVDESIVKVTLNNPSIFVNDMIAGCNNGAVIYPAEVIENADADTGYIKDYIGTGPYKFVEWVPDQYVLLEKNAEYAPADNGARHGYAAAAVPVTEKLYYDFVPDDSTRTAGIQTGEYDMIYKAPYDNYDMLKNDDSLDIYNSVYGDIWMVFNKKEGIATDQKLRQAIQMSLDNDEIMIGAYSVPDAFRTDGSYMLEEQSVWYNHEDDAAYNQKDTEGAKALLQESGYNGEAFRLLVSPDYSDMYNAAIVIQSQLKKIGINVELVTADWATFTSYRADETMYDGFITTGPAPILPTTILYISSGWPGWAADEKLQSMLVELNTMANSEEGIQLWSEIQAYCSNEYVPICKLGDIYRFNVATNKLKNIETYGFAPLFWNAYVEE
ncbi:ABC transporter substrate-binding protein [Lachnospiraceae bacterium 54-53]